MNSHKKLRKNHIDPVSDSENQEHTALQKMRSTYSKLNMLSPPADDDVMHKQDESKIKCAPNLEPHTPSYKKANIDDGYETDIDIDDTDEMFSGYRNSPRP